MKIISNLLFSWLTFFAVWLALTLSFSLDEILTGSGISLLLAVLFVKNYTTTGMRFFGPRKFFYILKYIIVFSLELIKSNLNVARIVLHPKLPINPGIVKFKTSLTSNTAKMLLANSITLTPGTLTVDIVDDIYYIHWLTVESNDLKENYDHIAKTFEEILKEIYS